MDDRKVKGTMVLDYARMIRSNKQLGWDKYLQPEDWDIINAKILPASWYPFEFFNRCAIASFQLLAKGNLDLARSDGQRMGKRLFETTYKIFVQTKDPARALNQFVSTYSGLFNFSVLRFKQVGPDHVKIHFSYDGPDKDTIPYTHQLQGMLETLVEMSDGKNGKVDIASKQWQGAPESVFDITWQ